MPLIPRSPYTDSIAAAAAPAVERECAFVLGYFVERPGAAALARRVKTPLGEALLFAPFNPDNQTLLRVGPFPFRIPVRQFAKE